MADVKAISTDLPPKKQRVKRSLERNPIERHSVIKNSLGFDERRYEFDDKFVPWNKKNDGNQVHTTHELYELLKNDPSIGLEGTVLGYSHKERSIGHRHITKQLFIESIEKNDSGKRFKESLFDPFLIDQDISGGQNQLVGEDFVPLLGGPFYKQLYIYDYLRMHGYCFWAANHWPMARAAINIIRDFTLGRGYRVDVMDQNGKPHPKAEALWAAFEEANNLQDLMSSIAMELPIYGETMLWWLPDGETKITYQLSPGQAPPTGIIPRVRLIDPSCIWEIVTYPEDITRVLYYQWVSPTQYQIYTNGSVPSTKFIMQQVPADQVDHFKINCVSNEKRGRSDLFSALGYMKRLSDSVNYSIVGMQKASAWSIDTTVDGNQNDLNQYMAAQQALGTIPTAASEFIHSTKIKREYLGNQSGGRGTFPAFEWAFSMAAMSLGIPVSYFGTHLSGGQTRASALVATEPVAKRLEMRQVVYEKILHKMAKRLFKYFNIQDAQIEVTMPELLVQDRSMKLKDLALAEMQGWISKDRAATMASKEFQVSNFNYDDEKKIIDAQPQVGPIEPNPLTLGVGEMPGQPSGVSSAFRKSVDQNDGA